VLARLRGLLVRVLGGLLGLVELGAVECRAGKVRSGLVEGKVYRW